MLKRITCIIAAFAVCLSLVVVPVSADTYVFYELPRTSVAGSYADGVSVFSSSGTPLYYAWQSSYVDGAPSIYCCYVYTNSAHTRIKPLFLVKPSPGSSSSVYVYLSRAFLSSSTPSVQTLTSSNVSGAWPGYSSDYWNNDWAVNEVDLTLSVSIFDSVDAAREAFSSWTPSPSNPVYSGPLAVTVPAGYVLTFRVSEPVTASLSCSFAANISVFGFFSQDGFSSRFGSCPVLASGDTYAFNNGDSAQWLLHLSTFGFGSTFLSNHTFYRTLSASVSYVYNPDLSFFELDDEEVIEYLPNQDLVVTFPDASKVSELTLNPVIGLPNPDSQIVPKISETVPIVTITVDSTGEQTLSEPTIPSGGEGDISGLLFQLTSFPAHHIYDLYSIYAVGLTYYGAVFTLLPAFFTSLIFVYLLVIGVLGFLSSSRKH